MYTTLETYITKMYMFILHLFSQVNKNKVDKIEVATLIGGNPQSKKCISKNIIYVNINMLFCFNKKLSPINFL